MPNYSFYPVFLDYNVVQGLCWSMVIISVPCNILVILGFILLNCGYSRILTTKTLFSFHQSRFSISHNPSIFLLFNLSLGDFMACIYLLAMVIGDGTYSNYNQHLDRHRYNYSIMRND